MNQETTQPFDQIQRDPRDERLVSEVLGGRAAKEMIELAGKDAIAEPTTTSPLEMSDEEKGAAKGIEEAPTPEERREEYIKWANEMGKSDKWVDWHFTFLLNGNVETTNKDLSLPNVHVERFPTSLTKVNGCFSIFASRWKIPLDFLKNIEVTKEISIDVTDVDRFPEGARCRGIIVYHNKDLPDEDGDQIIKKMSDKGYNKKVSLQSY